MPAEKRSLITMIMEVTAPIFDREMGRRMSIARMKMLLDQRELGELLGCSQQQISRLESGSMRVLERPFTTAKLQEVFQKSTSFILFGTGEDRFPVGHIRDTYWRHRHSKQGNRTPWNERKNKSDQSTKS